MRDYHVGLLDGQPATLDAASPRLADLVLPNAETRLALVQHNFRVDAAGGTTTFLVGNREMTAAEAADEVAKGTPAAKALLALGTAFIQALLAARRA